MRALAGRSPPRREAAAHHQGCTRDRSEPDRGASGPRGAIDRARRSCSEELRAVRNWSARLDDVPVQVARRLRLDGIARSGA